MELVQKAQRPTEDAFKNISRGDDRLAARRLAAALSPSLTVTSTAFIEGGPLPHECTSEATGLAPPISWSSPPATTKSVLIVCEDPDAPLLEPFVHWMVFDIPPSTKGVDTRSLAELPQGMNSLHTSAFAPAAPPRGSGLHHYHFQVFALDVMTEAAPHIDRRALFELAADHVVAWGELVGTCERR